MSGAVISIMPNVTQKLESVTVNANIVNPTTPTIHSTNANQYCEIQFLKNNSPSAITIRLRCSITAITLATWNFTPGQAFAPFQDIMTSAIAGALVGVAGSQKLIIPPQHELVLFNAGTYNIQLIGIQYTNTPLI